MTRNQHSGDFVEMSKKRVFLEVVTRNGKDIWNIHVMLHVVGIHFGLDNYNVNVSLCRLKRHCYKVTVTD